MAGKVEPRLFPPRLCLYHGVARLGGSARLGGDYRERPAKLSVELVEHEVVSVGIGVIEKEHFHLVRFRRAQSLRNELGAERGTAYAYAKDIFKFPVRARDFAAVDLFGKTLYLGDVALNLRLDFGSGRELRRAEPIVADHSVFVGIGDGAGFERDHRGERLLRGLLHRCQKSVVETDSADVQTEPQIFKPEVVFFIAFPRHNIGLKN